MTSLRAVFVLLLLCVAAGAQQYDVLIRNGRLVDGSGNPWVYADVGITGDRVTFVGKAAADVKAKREIDASGLVVAPGFIDMLGQSETSVLVDPRAVSKLTQGITTEITGEGGSVAPMTEPLIEEDREYLQKYKLTVDWNSLAEYFTRLERQPIGVNLATFVGATQVRKAVIGNDDRAPNAQELARMEEYVNDAMLDGALGLSTSLIYAPAFYAKTDELVALAKVAARHNGVYATHIRNEGDTIQQALEEAFQIGREAKLPVQIWHLKVSGRQNWGKMRDAVNAIERARAAGLDVAADQYPYVASATSLATVIPPKYHDGGREAMLGRLKDPAQRQAIREDLERATSTGENMWRGVGGPEGVLVASVLNPELKQWEGKTIAQIAKAQNKEPLDALMDLLIAGNANIGAVYFSMSEPDVRLAMQQPWVAVNTDYGAVATDGPLSDHKVHPRAYGTFPRILGRYVREESVLKLEEAIRKMTSLAAQRVKLENRGLVRPGYFADLTLFDPQTITDVATFEDPNRTSRGIAYVFVNGVLSVERDKLTGQLGGRPLRGPGWSGREYSVDGAAPRGKIEGVVTDAGGWPMLRATLTVKDAMGKELGTATVRKDGRYEIPFNEPCARCTINVERMGFMPQTRTFDYNGANSLWFGFVLRR